MAINVYRLKKLKLIEQIKSDLHTFICAHVVSNSNNFLLTISPRILTHDLKDKLRKPNTDLQLNISSPQTQYYNKVLRFHLI